MTDYVRVVQCDRAIHRKRVYRRLIDGLVGRTLEAERCDWGRAMCKLPQTLSVGRTDGSRYQQNYILLQKSEYEPVEITAAPPRRRR